MSLYANKFILASPCTGKTVPTNVPHPTDSTKYISCLNENKYEIMECPQGFIYTAENDKCESIQVESICDQQPCLNNGQCYSTGSTSYTCTCQGPWTGERCEIPLSPCASNPCGQGNECIRLVTNDYNQNYICVCDKQQSYGLTCEQSNSLEFTFIIKKTIKFYFFLTNRYGTESMYWFIRQSRTILFICIQYSCLHPMRWRFTSYPVMCTWFKLE